jgi:ABC-type glycerol-3-phosphate transport system permease component
MLFGSFRPDSEIISSVNPLSIKTFWPDQWTLRNYADVLGITTTGEMLGLNAGRNLLNSGIVSFSVVVLSLTTSTLAAYVFSRINFKGREIVFWIFLATMFIPWQATIVPLYLVVQSLGVTDSYLGLILPWTTSPFVIFMMRQYFNTIPLDFDEAAKMDGASHFNILTRILLPNSLPALVSVGLIELQNIWNEFYWPLVSTSSKNLQVIQVAILLQSGPTTQYWGRVFAVSVLAALPVVLAFLIFQPYYMRAMLSSGFK